MRIAWTSYKVPSLRPYDEDYVDVMVTIAGRPEPRGLRDVSALHKEIIWPPEQRKRL